MRYFNIPHYKALVELKRRLDRVNVEGMDIAQRRLKILKFFDRYGLKATEEAFGVKKSTIYLWKGLLRDNGNEIRALIPLSRRPKGRRVRETPRIIIEFIKDYRNKHYRAGQDVIK
ncbi:MAG: hypothetical protein ACP5PA_04890, partial [Elusimicrobiales bacterium]